MESGTPKGKSRKSTPYYRLLAWVFALLLGAFSLANFITPDRTVSLKEKRMLTTFSLPPAERVLEGAYSNDFEEYASDQILFRDFFTELKVLGDRLLGKKESQGIYRGRDGFLLERMETPDPAIYGESLEAIAAFAARTDIPQYFVLVPNAVSVYAGKLPFAAPSYSQEAFSETVREGLGEAADYLSLYPALREANSADYLYYRSDHHWTSWAAHICAPGVLRFLGRDWQGDWTPLAVSSNFQGSLAAKSGFLASPADSIYLFVPPRESTYLLSDSQGKRASLYSREGLLSNDPYTLFLAGNEGLVQLETEHIGAGHLLVFKDSYFNCFLPFLLDAYESIDVVDPRYFSEELSSLLYQKEYDQILYFYNCNTFAQDSSLSLVLEEALRP